MLQRSIHHCSETDGLLKVAEDRGWTNVDAKGVALDKNFVSWKFKDDAKESDRGASFAQVLLPGKDTGIDTKIGGIMTRRRIPINGSTAESHIWISTPVSSWKQKQWSVLAKETGPVDDHAHLLYR